MAVPASRCKGIISKQVYSSVRAQELCENRGGRPGLPVPNSPYGLRGRKATLNLDMFVTEIRSCVKV